jgi:TIGR03009 family protein
MRTHGVTLAALLLLAPLATAQMPPGGGSPIIPVPGNNGGQPIKPMGFPVGGQPGGLQPVLNPQENPLDRHLLKWQEEMTKIESIWAKLDRYEKLKDGTTRVFKGEARYLKPNLAALQMVRQDNPNKYEMYICSNQYFYEYKPDTKEIFYRKLEMKEMQAQSNFLSFLFGMNAAEAKGRYTLKLGKENENYIYITIEPRLDADMREFKKAEMVLLAKTMMPRRLWFEHINGDEITWDVTSMDTATKLKAADFVAPQPPGWTAKAQTELPKAPPANIPPRVVRPSSRP